MSEISDLYHIRATLGQLRQDKPHKLYLIWPIIIRFCFKATIVAPSGHEKQMHR